jgi:hypothetical protein
MVASVSQPGGRNASLQRASVTRPPGAAMSYACPSCDIILYDGVAYSWCPACSHPVDWVDLCKPFWCCDRCEAFVNEARADWPTCAACQRAMTRVHALESPPPPASSSGPDRIAKISSMVLLLAMLAQFVVLALHPLGFIVIAPYALLALLGACAYLVVLFASLDELRALVRDHHTQVIHGLEHACLKLLERRGLEHRGGRTHEGFFEIEVKNNGRASIEAVRQATYEAMTRLAQGERSLALDPRCGTSLMVAVFIVSALIVFTTVAAFLIGVPAGILAAGTAVAALLVWFASRPLGLLAQRTLTVSTSFVGAAVHRIVRVVGASGDTATFLVYLRIQGAAR